MASTPPFFSHLRAKFQVANEGIWNAQDAEVHLWSLSGFLEAFKGSRPVLAALAHTHVGAVAFVVGITIRD